MMKLVALKRVYYPRGRGGREYQPGEVFDALSERDAKALTLVRAAKVAPAPPAATAGVYERRDMVARDPLDHDRDGRKGGSERPEGDADELATLRDEYLTVVGRRPFNGWDAATLREKIAAAKA